MREMWCGLGWCEECQQQVDIYTQDGRTHYCGICGKKVKEKR